MVKGQNPIWIENKWFNGIAPDPYVWADGTFQYSQNVNIRNNLKWITLSSEEENRDLSVFLNAYLVFADPTWWPTAPKLLKFYSNWELKETDNNWNVEVLRLTTPIAVSAAFSFKTKIYAFGNNVVYEIDPVAWTFVDITAALPWYAWAYRTFGLNYWNNTLVIWNQNIIWTLWPDPSVATPVFPTDYIWQQRREFSEWNEIVWISNSWWNIKVYTAYQYSDSRVFYLPATFDVGFEWINETIERKWMNVRNIAIVWKTDNVVARGSWLDSVWVINWSLYETSWYDREPVYTTCDWNLNPNYITQFLMNDHSQVYPVYWDIAYMAWVDWIWSYWRKTPWINKSLVKEWSYADRSPRTSIVFWDYLYVSYDIFWVGSREKRYYLANRPQSFNTSTWMVISRVYNGDFAKDSKSCIELFASYELEPTSSDPGYIEVYLRENRKQKNITGWRQLVATITDKTKNRQRIIANQMNIDFNLLEYKVHLYRWTDATVAPQFNEIYLEYEINQKP